MWGLTLTTLTQPTSREEATNGRDEVYQVGSRAYQQRHQRKPVPLWYLVIPLWCSWAASLPQVTNSLNWYWICAALLYKLGACWQLRLPLGNITSNRSLPFLGNFFKLPKYSAYVLLHSLYKDQWINSDRLRPPIFLSTKTNELTLISYLSLYKDQWTNPTLLFVLQRPMN